MMETGKTILIVDDDQDFRTIWKHKLVSEGFNVLEAENGEEAIKIIQEQKPDLILLDVLMPKMNGMEAFLKIKDKIGLENTKIIFVTSLDETSEDFEISKEYHKKLSKEIGAYEYLSKSTDLDKLVDKVKEALGLNQ